MSVILDCELMKYPFSGLYFYCKNLEQHINQIYQEQNRPPLRLYLPPENEVPLPPASYHIREKKYHKFWQPFLNSCKVWHAPFQSGRIYPKPQRHPKIKILLTIHDLNALHEGKTEQQQKKSLQHTQQLIDRSDTIVCISQFVKDDVEKHCNVSGKNLLVIHNGVNVPVAPSLQKESYKPTRPFLFGVGYVNKKKNYLVLLPLLQSNRELELVIAGRLDEPEYVEEIKTTAKQMGVADRLTITGPVSEAEKSWYLHHCTAFLHPSLAEGFGATVVEGMILGKPVFLSRRTSLPEIGGDAGFYFDHYEAEHIQKVFAEGMHLMATTQHRDKLYQQAAQFSWHDAASQYIAAYDALLDKG